MGSLSRDDGFLPSLTRAFKSLNAQAQVNTRAFVEAVASILPVFDDLGMSELQGYFHVSGFSPRESPSFAAYNLCSGLTSLCVEHPTNTSKATELGYLRLINI